MELVTDEKIRTKVLRSELRGEGLKLDSLVRCIHCGKVFYGDERASSRKVMITWFIANFRIVMVLLLI